MCFTEIVISTIPRYNAVESTANMYMQNNLTRIIQRQSRSRLDSVRAYRVFTCVYPSPRERENVSYLRMFCMFVTTLLNQIHKTSCEWQHR